MRMTFVLDLAERTAATYAEAFAGLLLADSTHMLNLGMLRAMAVAALPAALTVLKAALGGALSTTGGAAWLPAPQPAAPVPAANWIPAAAAPADVVPPAAQPEPPATAV